MLTVIFGREGCPFCVRAKDVAEKLANERDDFKYRYIDIIKEGIHTHIDSMIGARLQQLGGTVHQLKGLFGTMKYLVATQISYHL